ncbi:cadmium-translocating P-type ATPase [Patescibacteria group bacterium AH-259-L07]|nr:cadmium-translocating P-type ATPase [Patescibacteria group bacterium AH-259-L07]
MTKLLSNMKQKGSSIFDSKKILSTLLQREYIFEIVRIVFVGSLIPLVWTEFLPLPFLFLAIAVGLYPIAKKAIIGILKKRMVNTELFITLATVIAVMGKEYIAATVILFLILIAEYVEELSGERARSSIKELIGTVPKIAVVRRNNEEVAIPIEKIEQGDIVLVRAGEQIPVDGNIAKGEASVNQAPITGESVPVDKINGDKVFTGTILESGALDIRVERVGEETMFARIIALVEEAEGKKAPIQKLADKVTTYLIPLVFLFIAGVYFFTQDIRLIITLLIFTSPAELGLATPLVMISAIARAAHQGVLVKGGIFLEQLSKVDTIIFDKTGTLTFGEPRVVEIELLDKTITEKKLLELSSAAERRSSHPLAKAVVRYAKEKQIVIPEPTEFHLLSGGVSARVSHNLVQIGNRNFFQNQGIELSHVTSCSDSTHTTLYVALSSNIVGRFCFADVLRKGSREAIKELISRGLRVMLLTGDNTNTAKHIAQALGIKEVWAELTPKDKFEIIAKLQKEGRMVAMVGDGINDAPALAQADVGIAMGVIGSEAAIEAADIALMTDDLQHIIEAHDISRQAYHTVKQNIFWGVGVVHVAGIALALLKIIGPIEAAIIHFFPDLFVFLNSIKLLRVPGKDSKIRPD